MIKLSLENRKSMYDLFLVMFQEIVNEEYDSTQINDELVYSIIDSNFLIHEKFLLLKDLIEKYIKEEK